MNLVDISWWEFHIRASGRHALQQWTTRQVDEYRRTQELKWRKRKIRIKSVTKSWQIINCQHPSWATSIFRPIWPYLGLSTINPSTLSNLGAIGIPAGFTVRRSSVPAVLSRLCIVPTGMTVVLRAALTVIPACLGLLQVLVTVIVLLLFRVLLSLPGVGGCWEGMEVNGRDEPSRCTEKGVQSGVVGFYWVEQDFEDLMRKMLSLVFLFLITSTSLLDQKRKVHILPNLPTSPRMAPSVKHQKIRCKVRLKAVRKTWSRR